MMVPVLQYPLAATPTTCALQGLIKTLEATTERHVVVADLSLGSWTAHSLAMQLLSQLFGKELKTSRWQPGKDEILGRSNPNIDEDARGNTVVRMTHALSVRIKRALEDQLTSALVLVPCFGHTWRIEDRLLLEYLQTRCPMLQITLAYVDAASAVWPQEWEVKHLPQKIGEGLTERDDVEPVVALLPGLLSPRHRRCLNRAATLDLIPLSSGWAVIAPEDRLAASRQQYRFQNEDLVRLQTMGLAEFVPYTLMHGAYLADGGVLLRNEAWLQFAAGGRDLALQMMGQAVDCSENLHTRAIAVANHKKMLVAMARYAEASIATPLLLEALPAQDRRLLLEWQGWALVMNSQGQESRACLTEALSLTDPTCEDAEHLFLMNITALSELRCGNHGRAYDLEKQIEAVLGSQQYPDEGMVYINSLNLARLLRYAKAWGNSAFYYRRAFATAEGAPSDTDRVNEELCQARLAEDQEHWLQAFNSMFRASLYWLASDCPETLSWRVQNLLLGNRAFKTISHLGEVNECVEQLALVLYTTLQQFEKAAGLEHYEICGNTAVTLHFHDDSSPLSDQAVYLGGPQWAVIADPISQDGCGYGPHFETLKQYVATRIARFHGLEEVNTLRIARNDGRSMPSTAEAMLQQATSLAIKTAHFGEGHIQLSSRASESWQFLQRSHLVQRTEFDKEGATVFFRRYLAPCRLTVSEAAVYRNVNDLVPFNDVCSGFSHLELKAEDVKQILRTLRRKNILALHPGPDSFVPGSMLQPRIFYSIQPYMQHAQ